MDLFGRFRKLDSSLQRGLDNGFARVFGGEVVPAEIDELLKQQAESSVMMDPDGHRWAPCHFMVNVSKRDYDSLLSNNENLETDLGDRLQRYIRNSGWQTNAPVSVTVDADQGLHSGQLKANSMFNAPPARRKQDEDSSDANPGLSGIVREAPGSDYNAESRNASNNGGQSNGNQWDRAEQSQEQGRGYGAAPQNNGYGAAGAAAGAAGAGAAGAAAAGTFTNEWNRHPGEDAYGSGYGNQSANGQANQDNGYGDGQDNQGNGANNPQQYNQYNEQEAAEFGEQPHAQEGYTAQPQQPASQDPNRPMSYPGTEVMAQNLHKEEPITGGSGEANEQKTTVTLILRDGSDRKYELREGSNLIGRGNGVDLRIPDTGVSRQHAEIAWDGYDAVLTDLQSTNGTSVNETPIENWLLADGDIIVMGHSEIEVRFG